ncbi:bidirectional sugar transporter SWEET2a-like [Malus domestica]|uniref:bidirectional sugar transporter SWEET2a-like n=1 Tax=Malus domestica TaxID=3750 RepID=UPI0039759707
MVQVLWVPLLEYCYRHCRYHSSSKHHIILLPFFLYKRYRRKGKLKSGLRCRGNVFAFVLFLSPIPTFKRIVITKSTEQFSGLPYIYALLNCLICSWYGLPVVKTGIILVATVNSVVAVFQLVYLSMFIRYTERAIKLRMMGLIAAIFVVFAFVVFVSLGLLDYDERQTFVRYLSVASLISMFASPLFIIKLVIKTRSVEFMPFNLSLATFLMSLSFSAYGVFKKDPFPLYPKWYWNNFRACPIGSVLLLQQCIWRCLKRTVDSFVRLTNGLASLILKYSKIK